MVDMTFEDLLYFARTLFLAFAAVIVLSIVIYLIRCAVRSIIYFAEIKVIKRGRDNAKNVISLYRAGETVNSLLAFFQCCVIGTYSRSAVRDYLPNKKRIKMNKNRIMFWVEITLFFFLFLNPYYVELISNIIPPIDTGLLGDLALNAKSNLTIVATAVSAIVSGTSKAIKRLHSKGNLRIAIIKDTQKDDCRRLIEAHKRIRGVLVQIEKDESHEIEELIKNLKTQPSLCIREAIEESMPSLRYSYTDNKFIPQRDVVFELGRTFRALAMYEEDMCERKSRLEKGTKEIRSIIEEYDAQASPFRLYDIKEIDRKTGKAYLRIRLDLETGLSDCVSRAEILEQTKNHVNDDLIEIYSDVELAEYANDILGTMQNHLYLELIDGIELLVRLRNYINAFEQMYRLSK